MTTYKVVSGDTLWKIAIKHGIELDELLKANQQITNSSLIYPGQVINIPSISSSTYTVVVGDTLWKIAKEYGISVDELLVANPQIKNSSLIYAGQIINIPSETSKPIIPGASSDLTAMGAEVIRLVNNERKKAGRSPLAENKELSNVAILKANDFITNNYFAHNSPTYGTPFEMMRSYGINFTAGGENIASGPKSAAEVMNNWMNSSGHKANILSSNYNQIGVGVAKDDKGNMYWVQLFIRS